MGGWRKRHSVDPEARIRTRVLLDELDPMASLDLLDRPLERRGPQEARVEYQVRRAHHRQHLPELCRQALAGRIPQVILDLVVPVCSHGGPPGVEVEGGVELAGQDRIGRGAVAYPREQSLPVGPGASALRRL